MNRSEGSVSLCAIQLRVLTTDSIVVISFDTIVRSVRGGGPSANRQYYSAWNIKIIKRHRTIRFLAGKQRKSRSNFQKEIFTAGSYPDNQVRRWRKIFYMRKYARNSTRLELLPYTARGIESRSNFHFLLHNHIDEFRAEKMRFAINAKRPNLCHAQTQRDIGEDTTRGIARSHLKRGVNEDALVPSIRPQIGRITFAHSLHASPHCRSRYRVNENNAESPRHESTSRYAFR